MTPAQADRIAAQLWNVLGPDAGPMPLDFRVAVAAVVEDAVNQALKRAAELVKIWDHVCGPELARRIVTLEAGERGEGEPNAT